MVGCVHPTASQTAMYFTGEDEVYAIESHANAVAETGIATLNKAGNGGDMGGG